MTYDQTKIALPPVEPETTRRLKPIAEALLLEAAWRAGLVRTIIAALSEGEKPEEDRLAPDVKWTEDVLLDTLAESGLAITQWHIKRTLTGEDNDPAALTD